MLTEGAVVVEIEQPVSPEKFVLTQHEAALERVGFVQKFAIQFRPGSELVGVCMFQPETKQILNVCVGNFLGIFTDISAPILKKPEPQSSRYAKLS